MAFAADPATHAYYERRAREYDDWWEGRGLFAGRERPGWEAERRKLIELIAGLPAVRTLDVACGTGYLTRHLRGPLVGVDRSQSMVEMARARLPDGLVVRGDALALPFAPHSFDRVFSAHFYGHLPPVERVRFLAEAGRVAPELVVVDSALRPGVEPEGWQERRLKDGSRHRVFKRFLDADGLAAEIDGEAVLRGRWFVAARRDTEM